MSFEVKYSQSFRKDVKPLSKKYHSLKTELNDLINSLESNPFQGTSLGKDCYKIRLSIASKGKGKRGGARVITYVITDNKEVILLAIYDKQVKNDLKANELDNLLEQL